MTDFSSYTHKWRVTINNRSYADVNKATKRNRQPVSCQPCRLREARRVSVDLSTALEKPRPTTQESVMVTTSQATMVLTDPQVTQQHHSISAWAWTWGRLRTSCRTQIISRLLIGRSLISSHYGMDKTQTLLCSTRRAWDSFWRQKRHWTYTVM